MRHAVLCRSPIALLGALCLPTATSLAAPLTLVDGGRPTSVIVTSDEPVDCQVEAARELQEHLRLMTGAAARLPL